MFVFVANAHNSQMILKRSVDWLIDWLIVLLIDWLIYKGSEERISNGVVAVSGDVSEKGNRSPDKQIPQPDSSPDTAKVGHSTSLPYLRPVHCRLVHL